MTRSTKVWAIAAGAAGLGLLLGHKATYLMMSSDVREHVLGSTGHGYMGTALSAALVGALVTALVIAAGSIAAGRGGRSGGTSFAGLAGRLAALQSVSYLAFEVIERAVSGRVTHHLLPALLLAGIAIQVLFACLSAFAIKVLGRIAHDLGVLLAAKPVFGPSKSTKVWYPNPAALSGSEPGLRLQPRAPPLAA